MQTNLIYEILLDIGLSEMSSQIYLQLLIDQNITVTKLAEILNIHRASVYNYFLELEKADLITREDKTKWDFYVESPSKLAGFLALKENRTRNLSSDLNALLPDLLNKFNTHNKRPIVKFLEGRNNFVRLFEQVLFENPEIIRFYGNTDRFYDLVGFDFQVHWSKMRAKKNIKTKLLVFYSHRLDTLKDENIAQKREIKWLPDKYNCDGAFYIYNNKVILWNTVLSRATLIEDLVICDTFLSFFNLIWDGLPVTENKNPRK